MAASSKITLFLLTCLLFALVVIASASDDQSKGSVNPNGVEAKYRSPDYGYPGNGNYGGGRSGYRGYPSRRGYCRHGCCRGNRYSNDCDRCCSHANENPDAEFEDDSKHQLISPNN